MAGVVSESTAGRLADQPSEVAGRLADQPLESDTLAVRAPVADVVARLLAERGVTAVFELTGGMITRLLDAIHCLGRTRIVSMHHEQGAGFAAEGSARITGHAAVAMGTSGPGATNLLTAVGDCYFDSTPAVFITGQVNRNEQRGDRGVRQLGFQETDIVSMAAPVTKWSYAVTDPAEVADVLQRAFDIAESGRPGPVLIDIPMDVQRIEVDVPEAWQPRTRPALEEPARAALSGYVGELAQALAESSRPLIIAGGGIRAAGAAQLFSDFVAGCGIPVAYSLMAVDALPGDDPRRVGLIGSYGNRWANLAVGAADLLIVLGSRLDVRQTGALAQQFKGEREMFHVDIDAPELDNRVKGARTLVCDLRDFLPAAAAALPKYEYRDWLEWIEQTRRTHPDSAELAGCAGINPNEFVAQLAAATPQVAAYVADVGQHQMWVAQSLRPGAQQRFITSGGMGAMGFALPAAIGATLAAAAPVVVIAGDGGFQCNIQELQTVAHHQLPLKIVVLDNSTLGMVRQFQESYMQGRYQSTLWGYSAPDFEAVASAYGIPARSLTTADQAGEALAWLAAAPGPALLEVAVDTFTNTFPKIAFGQPITVMESAGDEPGAS